MSANYYKMSKWEFARLDDVDLLCEITISSSCKWPGLCGSCRLHLTWCLEILQNRWDDLKYIDFYDALKVMKENKKLFNKSFNFFEHWRKEKILQLISR